MTKHVAHIHASYINDSESLFRDFI